MTDDERKRRGAWYTPEPLVATVVEAVVDQSLVDRVGLRPVRVLDPACGDARFLRAVSERVAALGGAVELTGIDIDATALDAARRSLPEARLLHADALSDDGASALGTVFDVVVGNPPYLSQLASSTTRGAASRHGGGPYADAAVEFLALAASIVEPEGGRVAYVLPQSILSARDGEPVRRSIDERAQMIWSSWTGQRDFDAEVLTCALAFEFGRPGTGRPGSWAHVVTERTGVPPVPAALVTEAASVGDAGTLGDRAWLNANFRDEYYGMIPAVGDHESGPALVTSGLIDPGRSLWGERPVRFAKQRFDAPRLDLSMLDPKMRAWADRRLVPKVLVANQTPVLEAVADPEGGWLPGVPVVAIYPTVEGGEAARSTHEIAAVLTSPSASAWAWHERGGTGLSANTIRVGPVMLAALPWPTGDLGAAVEALRSGDVIGCGRAVDRAYGVGDDEASALMAWWKPIIERIQARSG